MKMALSEMVRSKERHMNVQEFKSFLEENKDNDDLKAVVGEVFQPSSLDAALETFKGSKEMQSFIDRIETKGIEKYQKNHEQELEEKAQKLAEEKFQSMSQEDPKDLELKKLRKEFENERKERMVEKNKNLALGLLQEKKLPSGFSDFLVTDDEEKTKERFGAFSSLMDSVLEEKTKQALSGVKSDPPSSSSNAIDSEPAPDASAEEWKEYWRSQKNKEK